MSEEKKSDFIIKDKRIFSQDPENQDNQDDENNIKDDAINNDENKDSKEEDGKTDSESLSDKENTTDFQMPEINFATFIMSLNASVLLHLGIIENPTTKKKETNLPMGKQTIDILGMLEEKTKGNLDKEEEQMLKNILYDLRMIYVKVKE